MKKLVALALSLVMLISAASTALAYSPTPIMEDSTWIWPSINPGAMYCPSASITRVSGPMQWEPSPTRAILPWAMATSVCS